MKLVTCILGVAFLLAVFLETARGKTCQSGEQCRDDECCMTKSAFQGGCRAKGCEGSPCLPNNVKSNLGDIYLMSCPCLEGLECVPGKIIENSEERTLEYLDSTCQPTEALVTRRLLEKRKMPRFLHRMLGIK